MSHTEIRANSAELVHLHQAVHSTLEARGPDWQAACDEFRLRFDQLFFPGGETMLRKVRLGEPIAVENAIRFLAVDPLHFRSGYAKEYLWRWVGRMELLSRQRVRLQRAALRYLDRRVSREFWIMGKAMHYLADPGFWTRVTVRLSREDVVGTRALYLLTYRPSVHAGAILRRRLMRQAIKGLA